MNKEPYLKPEIKSDLVEPGAMATVREGSGGGTGCKFMLQFIRNPSGGVCCET